MIDEAPDNSFVSELHRSSRDPPPNFGIIVCFPEHGNWHFAGQLGYLLDFSRVWVWGFSSKSFYKARVSKFHINPSIAKPSDIAAVRTGDFKFQPQSQGGSRFRV